MTAGKTTKTVQSIEPNIRTLANGWLKAYGLKFYEEQENNEIINLLSTRYCNKLYLGFYDPDNTNSYNFTYYASELSDKEVLKICFNPKNLDNDENIF